MIPNANLKTVQGSLGGKVSEMQFEANATAHLMQMMSNLYSDTELAVIREYSTNAVDSHRMLGIDRPIEVELPTQLRSEFVVRDFGLGLSEDELVHLMGNYGASTKRETNTAAGFYGVGSKSALALVNTFSVRAVKDNHVTVAVIYVGANGAGVVEVIESKESEESNGVEVRIPVNPSYSFNEKVKDFFKYWEKGSVLIDGSAPYHFTDAPNIIEIEPGLFIDPDGYYGDSHVVMGGTPYEIDSYDFNRTLNRHLAVTVIAEIGDVDHTPNREALHYTPRVKDYLVTLAEHVNTMYESTIQRRIDSSNSLKEVVTLSSALNLHRVSFKGQNIYLGGRSEAWNYDINYNRMSRWDSVSYQAIYADDVRVLINKPTFSVLSTKQRKKIKMWKNQYGTDVSEFYQFSGPVPAALAEAKTVDWADIDAMEVPKVSRPRAPRPKTIPMQEREFQTIQRGENYTYSRLVSADLRVFYVLGENAHMGSYYRPRGGSADPSTYYRFLGEHLPADVQIVIINTSQEAAFKRAFPQAKVYNALVREQTRPSKIRLTKLQRQALATEERVLKKYSGLTEDKMIDRLASALLAPDLKDKVVWMETYTDRSVEDDEVEDYLDVKYPKLNYYGRDDEDIDYINAMYRYGKRRKK